MEDFIKIATVLGLGGLLERIVTFFINRYNTEKRFKNEYFKTIKNVKKVHSILSELHFNLDAQRTVILKSENGGGIPKVRNKIYSSIIYGVSNINDGEDLRSIWNKQLIDKSYSSMILDLIENNSICLIVDGTKNKNESFKEVYLEKGILKDLYSRDGIKRSYVFCIAFKKDCFIYLSVQLKDKDRILNQEDRDFLRMNISELASIFKEDKNL